MWLSLVEHLVRDQGVAGSNPVIPTMNCKGLRIPGPQLFFSSFHEMWLAYFRPGFFFPHRPGLHVVLKTEKEEISVQLGPGWDLERQEFKIAKGILKFRDETGVPVWGGGRR